MRRHTVNNDKIDINEVSIKYCFSCPYDGDCIATAQELCDYLKERCNIEREKYESEMAKRDKEALDKIEPLLPMYVIDIVSSLGLGYGYVQSLKRRGKLEYKIIKKRILITGVK